LAILQRRSSVFVVDDDASMRVSVKRLLREHGFSATLFGSTKALLDHDDFGKAICIVIDINLNDQSGIELRRWLMNERVTAPVIYITGNDSQVNRSAAIESGCIAYLTKPFTAQSFIESIERARAVVT
jgi:FixJ family two-component response regulator